MLCLLIIRVDFILLAFQFVALCWLWYQGTKLELLLLLRGVLATVAHTPIDANALWLSLIILLLGMCIWNVFSMSRVP